jgi:TRAP-type C4-dicarboxylate transport system permease small subunit
MRLFALVTALCLFLMMAITFVEVIGRYFLGAPLTGGEEIKAFLLGFTIFTALPLVTRQQRHIAVRSLANMLTGRALFVQRAIVLAGTVVGLGFIGWLMFGQAQSLRESGELTGYLDLPVAPPIYVFATLAWVAALMALERLVQHLRGGGEAGEDHAAGPE